MPVNLSQFSSHIRNVWVLRKPDISTPAIRKTSPCTMRLDPSSTLLTLCALAITRGQNLTQRCAGPDGNLTQECRGRHDSCLNERSPSLRNCAADLGRCADPDWKRVSCPEAGWVRCNGTFPGQCVNATLRCNKVFDCFDRSDEENCRRG